MERPEIDDEAVAAVAHLARLGLPAAEQAAAAGQLAGLLRHFKTLQEVDTTGVEPLVHAQAGAVSPAPGAPRDAADERQALLRLTEHVREGFFVVPRVLDADFSDGADG